jgi:Tfp pilus assembly protein PilV
MVRSTCPGAAGTGGRRGRWNPAGFTLVETLVAAGLLALALMPLAYMQSNGFRSGFASYEMVSASALALQLTEAVRNVPYEDHRLDATSGYVPPDGTLTNANPLAPNGTTWAACAPDKCGYTRKWRITANSPITNAKAIDVQVTWNELGASRSFVLSVIKSAGS